MAERLQRTLCLLAAILAMGTARAGQPDRAHASHATHLHGDAMVMNANDTVLPRDCSEIGRDYRFEVAAGTEFAAGRPGQVFAYDRNEFQVEPCSRVTVRFVNRDQVRHQWMVHGLPRYLYPGGMFHIEANGGASAEGTFIVPSDAATYLVHCDVAQHMEKGMKAQLVVGSGDGNLWAVPGISAPLVRGAYLPGRALMLTVVAVLAGLALAVLLTARLRRSTS